MLGSCVFTRSCRTGTRTVPELPLTDQRCQGKHSRGPASLVKDMRASGATVNFHGYPTTHDSTMQASLVDSTPFLAGRFAAVP
ncbi:Uncharacterised protein [Mycobacteroides abscessus subsp. abscessus]|nr:Uncharacterised protein [Mycobacteroides abscessus subsp. abscessus]